MSLPPIQVTAKASVVIGGVVGLLETPAGLILALVAAVAAVWIVKIIVDGIVAILITLFCLAAGAFALRYLTHHLSAVRAERAWRYLGIDQHGDSWHGLRPLPREYASDACDKCEQKISGSAWAVLRGPDGVEVLVCRQCYGKAVATFRRLRMLAETDWHKTIQGGRS